MSEPPPIKTIAPVSPENRLARIGNFRFSAVQFLVAMVLLFVTAPFVDDLKYGAAIDTVLITMVLVSGVLAVGRSHRTLVWAVILVMPAVAGKWLTHYWPGLMPAEIHIVTALIFVGFVEFQLLYFISRAPRVNSEVLCAGISGYLLLGMLWMFAYVLVSRMDPSGSFSFNIGTPATHGLESFDAYYFSFVTLSTVGYGDITPVSHGARTLAMMEAMTGTLYMAVLISRLVALYSFQDPGSSKRKD